MNFKHLYRKDRLNQVLKKLIGKHKLRKHQRKVLKAVYEGNDILAVMPTSGGKSLLYQLPAAYEHEESKDKDKADKVEVTVVISPLIALQEDQVSGLKKKGIPAVMINSTLSKDKRKEILTHLSKYALIYLAPEQLRSNDLRRAMNGVTVNRVAVDESHILPQAQLDFRPAYSEIGNFIQSFGYSIQIMALTATATEWDRNRIKESLGMREPKEFLFGVRRKNLSLNVKQISPLNGIGTQYECMEASFQQAVSNTLSGWNGKGRVIIYCPFKKRVKFIAKWIKACDYKHVGTYTGDLSHKQRKRASKKFRNGKIQIMVATSAFGLGIDRPDVRLVIHAGLPFSMDGYVQECGRAGRDGKEATCILLYSDQDYQKNKNYLSLNCESDVLPMKFYRLNQLRQITDKDSCHWKAIEDYFGEEPGRRCHRCDACRRKDLNGNGI